MTKAAIKPPATWDRFTIAAEIKRQGKTLTGIARDAGLRENACRKALLGENREGADAIAAALGIPFDVLFPTGFLQSRSRSNHAKPSAKPASMSRRKRVAAVDAGRADACGSRPT